MMDNSEIYVGLDIGTTSIKVIIAEHVKGQANIIGYGNTKSAGLNRGVIVDIDQVVATIRDAVNQAEKKANLDISEVTVGIPANFMVWFPSVMKMVTHKKLRRMTYIK